MVALDEGFHALKFFPAVPAGGIEMLKAIGGPLPQLRFCPTGGISPATAPDFLAIGNVACIGGSWLAPKSLDAAGDWDRRAAERREGNACVRTCRHLWARQHINK